MMTGRNDLRVVVAGVFGLAAEVVARAVEVVVVVDVVVVVVAGLQPKSEAGKTRFG